MDEMTSVPVEARLVHDVKSCRTCQWFWGGVLPYAQVGLVQADLRRGIDKATAGAIKALVKDIDKDSRLDPETRRIYKQDFQAQSTIITPLVVAGQWIGTIGGFYGAPVEFDEDEVRRLMALAGQAAT